MKINQINFQARQILEGEFERLVSEGTDRQLGVPSDGRNSSADSIGGSIGDRSISPISWDLASRQVTTADEEADRPSGEDDDTTLSLSDVSSVIKTVSNQPRRWIWTKKKAQCTLYQNLKICPKIQFFKKIQNCEF